MQTYKLEKGKIKKFNPEKITPASSEELGLYQIRRTLKNLKIKLKYIDNEKKILSDKKDEILAILAELGEEEVLEIKFASPLINKK